MAFELPTAIHGIDMSGSILSSGERSIALREKKKNISNRLKWLETTDLGYTMLCIRKASQRGEPT